MDKRIVLAREDLKKTNYWMITLIISALTLIILSLTNVLTINSNNEHYIDFTWISNRTFFCFICFSVH